MKTYQDLVDVGDDEKKKLKFVRAFIDEYRMSDMYKTALDAEAYYKKQNTTIMEYQKTLTTVTGRIVPDNYSANHKVVSGFFKRFVTDQVGFSLGNGVSFDGDDTKDALGGIKFDKAVQKAGKWACVGGVAYGFWNVDHVDVFKAKEFGPLLDEETGALRSGVKFWQLEDSKPLRAILYEEDGYTEMQWDKKHKDGIAEKKQPYITEVTKADVDSDEDAVIEWKNYPAFPIVPLWANEERQSELVGIKEGIDAYDLIKNGYENDLDSAQLYWVIKGAAGMEDPDLARFMDRLYKNKVAAPSDGQDIQPVTVNIPYDARERLLDRLENDLYRDFMVVNTDRIASGAVTATQIEASYKPQDAKADDFEYQIGEFIEAIMVLAGVEDTFGFERGYVINKTEMITNTLQASQFLPQDYTIKKILTLLGDGDMADSIIEQMQQEEVERMREEQAMQGLEDDGTGEMPQDAQEGPQDGGEGQALDEYSADVLKMLEGLLDELGGEEEETEEEE